MATIHPTAVVSPQAELGREVVIGPFCMVEAGAVIGDGCRLDARATVKEGTVIGRNNEIGEGAVIGGRAQHMHNGPIGGRLVIGDNNKFREFVTIHRGFKPEDCTYVGSNNLFMVGAHVAHDCIVADHVILVNNALLGGHVQVGQRAFVSGAVAVHQHCRIGAYAMVGGHTKIVKDVAPYVTCDGAPAAVVGLNKVGLRRAGFSNEDLLQLRGAYRLIYRRGLRWKDVLETLAEEFSVGPTKAFLDFFTTGKRGFVPERRSPKSAVIRLADGTNSSDSNDDSEDSRRDVA